MVSLRRFGPLLFVFALALAALVSRLYDVQVREHAVWARQAANLVRTQLIEPYQRGRILDREGRPFVRDQKTYELDFVWRDFRRSHPLGQVAALRSLAVGRPVSLEDARAWLEQWGEDFARLSPAEVEAFGRGEGLTVGALYLPPLAGDGGDVRRQARDERLPSRAGDLQYYVKALLHPSRRVARELPRDAGDPGWDRPWLELVARAEGVEPLERGRRLRTELARSLEDLDRLAQELTLDARDLPASVASLATPIDRLVGLIEDTRREVEADIADDLFERAAGFDPTRLSAANLARLDLDWLRRAMVWDDSRLATWREDRGLAFGAAVLDHLAGYAIARAKLEPDGRTGYDAGLFTPGRRVLSSLAYSFHGTDERTIPPSAVPLPWTEVDDLVVLASLPGHLARGRELALEAHAPLLPFQDDALRRERGLSDEELLARALQGANLPAPLVLDQDERVDPYTAAVRSVLTLVGSPRREWDPGQDAPFASALLAWDALLQTRVYELFDLVADPETGQVALTSEWIDLAAKARAYVVRDRGARPVRIGSEPAYDLVRLVTRYPERYAGFVVRSVNEREALAFLDDSAPDPVPVAEPLIGKVRPPALLNLLEQRPQEAALAELQQKRDLPESDREAILDLAGNAWQEGLSTGSTGLEAYLEPELRGRNGYRESTGLQDRHEGNRDPIYEEPVDGLDVRTTLDLDLQRAAELLLENPGPPPPGEDKPDRVWHAFPVGALCLITVDGDVLVAASGPSLEHDDTGPGRFDDERLQPHDRCLSQPTFQPPGSVFKPFVAAWALDHGWLRPQDTVDCRPSDGSPTLGAHRGDATVRCHSVHWDGVDLHSALIQSCNAYFASLGERAFDGESIRAMARAFGFDRPTGVRALDIEGLPARAGLREDFRGPTFFRDELQVAISPMLQRLANGLTHVSVTPLQVARAYAGLATGVLPELRLIDRIGDVEQPRRGAPLPLSRASLETVRAILADVPISGTAKNRGLDVATLGFTFACKTGSADYQKGLVPVDPLAPISNDVTSDAWTKGMRKHGWVAGWFPAERPVAVVVAYVHDTSTTSRHIATHLCARFLATPAVQAWAAEQGIGGVR